MKQQKCTVKRAVFEREFNHPKECLSFNGFKLPKEKDFLLEVLEELYGIYGDKCREGNDVILERSIRLGTRFVEIQITCKNMLKYPDKLYKWVPVITDYGPAYYPYEQELTFRSGGSYTAENGKRYHPSRGLYLHKSCILREKKESKDETTNVDSETSTV